MTLLARARRGVARVVPCLLSAGFGLACAQTPAPGPHRPPIEVPDTLKQRLQACFACHGPEGRATPDGFFPRIAGKPAGYLYDQLQNFRGGRRANATMSYLVDLMSDAYLHEIADWFAALDLPYPPPQPGAAPAELALGERLVRRGDAARAIPACVQCHGEAMTGVLPAVPGLLGLPRGYLVEQFGAWRNGQRKALAPDCMAQVASALSTAEVAAAATWLAAQPVSAGPAPAASLARPLPLECGSVPR
jgi:cytochrome c553